MKRIFTFLAATLLAGAMMLAGCEKPATPDDSEEPVEEPAEVENPYDGMSRFKISVTVTEDWTFIGKQPYFKFNIQNPNEKALPTEIKVKIFTDKGSSVTTLSLSADIPAGSTKEIPFPVDYNLEPGFYKANCTVKNGNSKTFFFGYNPTDIVSAPDKQEDFDAYWDNAKAQLAAVDMAPVLTEIPSRSSAARKVYLVEMNSAPDTPGGEPAVIRGYYLEPQDGKKHPVIVHFYGYDTLQNPEKIYCPYGGSSAEFAEFYLSTRGQIINHRPASKREDGIDRDFENTYGDWFAFQFGDKDGYYYRGAYMDCVQAVRFMADQPTSDMSNLFGEGKSQGGAFSYAAAALSDYTFKAIAPCVAFMGDFPDYFKIVSWPGNVAKANKGSMTDEQMYAFLSYFDTKNLAPRIKSSVIACIGLQDATCPPHTNIAPYNNLTVSDKEMHYYPEMGHEIPSDWEDKIMKYFKERIK